MQVLLLQRSLLVTSPPPPYTGSSTRPLAPRPPDFGRHPVPDPLRPLGPLETFSAHHRWSPPRDATVSRQPGQQLGFSLKREAPVVLVDVEAGGAAEVGSGDVRGWGREGKVWGSWMRSRLKI